MENKMLDSKVDNKNIGLLKNLHWLRQGLDVYCLISVNAVSIKSNGIGISFFGFLQRSCINSIALNICKIYEYEKNYEINSIEGVLKLITDEQLSVSDSSSICKFICKYENHPNEDDLLSSLSSTVAGFKKKFENELEWFKTFRDKQVAHSEFGFNLDSLPSYDIMERLFNFGAEFYMLVSTVFISTASVSVVPCDLNSNRKVKIGLIRMLSKLGLTDIKKEME
jgi:AbiU2